MSDIYSKLYVGKTLDEESDLTWVKKNIAKINAIITKEKKQWLKKKYIDVINLVIDNFDKPKRLFRKKPVVPKNDVARFATYRAQRADDEEWHMANLARQYIAKLNKKDGNKKNSVQRPSEACGTKYMIYQLDGDNVYRSEVLDMYCEKHGICRVH